MGCSAVSNANDANDAHTPTCANSAANNSMHSTTSSSRQLDTHTNTHGTNATSFKPNSHTCATSSTNEPHLHSQPNNTSPMDIFSAMISAPVSTRSKCKTRLSQSQSHHPLTQMDDGLYQQHHDQERHHSQVQLKTPHEESPQFSKVQEWIQKRNKSKQEKRRNRSSKKKNGTEVKVRLMVDGLLLDSDEAHAESKSFRSQLGQLGCLSAVIPVELLPRIDFSSGLDPRECKESCSTDEIGSDCVEETADGNPSNKPNQFSQNQVLHHNTILEAPSPDPATLPVPDSRHSEKLSSNNPRSGDNQKEMKEVCSVSEACAHHQVSAQTHSPIISLDRNASSIYHLQETSPRHCCIASVANQSQSTASSCDNILDDSMGLIKVTRILVAGKAVSKKSLLARSESVYHKSSPSQSRSPVSAMSVQSSSTPVVCNDSKTKREEDCEPDSTAGPLDCYQIEDDDVKSSHASCIMNNTGEDRLNGNNQRKLQQHHGAHDDNAKQSRVNVDADNSNQFNYFNRADKESTQRINLDERDECSVSSMNPMRTAGHVLASAVDGSWANYYDDDITKPIKERQVPIHNGSRNRQGNGDDTNDVSGMDSRAIDSESDNPNVNSEAICDSNIYTEKIIEKTQHDMHDSGCVDNDSYVGGQDPILKASNVAKTDHIVEQMKAAPGLSEHDGIMSISSKVADEINICDCRDGSFDSSRRQENHHEKNAGTQDEMHTNLMNSGVSCKYSDPRQEETKQRQFSQTNDNKHNDNKFEGSLHFSQTFSHEPPSQESSFFPMTQQMPDFDYFSQVSHALCFHILTQILC